MTLPANRPAQIVEYFGTRTTEPIALERPGGMSIGRVWRATFKGSSVIIKASPRATEMLFYRQVAPTLRRAGVPSPELLWSAGLDDRYWLVLEDVPSSFPFPDGSAPADERIFEVLARLHWATRG
jgi:hypothetical protein